jgi:hypothetical protein
MLGRLDRLLQTPPNLHQIGRVYSERLILLKESGSTVGADSRYARRELGRK